MKALLVAIVSLTLGLLTASAVTVGEPAPAFTLATPAGKSISLSDYKGKVVVLEWTNIGCPFVKKHYGSGNLPKLQKTYTGKGVIWLTICSSAAGKEGNDKPAADIAAVRTAWHAANTAYLADADGKVGRLYGAKTTPQLFVIDAKGILRYDGAIDSIPSADPADIPQAESYISEALDAVLAGQPVKTASTKSYGCSVKY
jgi:hypothetical protein